MRLDLAARGTRAPPRRRRSRGGRGSQAVISPELERVGKRLHLGVIAGFDRPGAVLHRQSTVRPASDGVPAVGSGPGSRSRRRCSLPQRVAHDLHPEQDHAGERADREHGERREDRHLLERVLRHPGAEEPDASTTTIIGRTRRRCTRPEGTLRRDERGELRVRRRLRRRVPRLPLRLQRRRLRGARHRRRGPARADRVERPRRRGDGRPRRARRRRPDRRARSALGRYLVRHWERVGLLEGESLVYWLRKLVFRGAWLDHRVKEGLLEVAWDEENGDFGYAEPRGGRALLELAPVPSLARAPVQAVASCSSLGSGRACRTTSVVVGRVSAT